MRKGFTLIELLIVIAVLGLLTSIVIAGFSRARELQVEQHLQGSQW